METRPVRHKKIYMTKKRKSYKRLTLIGISTTIILGSYLAGVLSETSHHHLDSIPEIKVVERVQAVEVPVYTMPEKDVVINYAIDKARENGLSVAETISVLTCESNFNPFARAKGSSAKGVAQFIDKTWANYCEGDVYNFQDNIDCFVKLYPNHKSWWECAK